MQQHSVIEGTSVHNVQEVQHGVHQQQEHGSYSLKQRESVPTDVSTYSLYCPAETAAPRLSICVHVPTHEEEDTGASCATE